MAIKVITHGKKPKFKKICSNCGCEFEYEQEDIVTDYNWNLTLSYPRRIKRVIICPDCGERLLHDIVVDQDWYPPIVTYNNLSTWPDCATCPNRPDPNKLAQVGDTPCTWCIKNRPYCTTGTISVTNDSNKNIKVTGGVNTQKLDFNNLHAYTSYTDIKSPEIKEEKNTASFSPEDIDLPQ